MPGGTAIKRWAPLSSPHCRRGERSVGNEAIVFLHRAKQEARPRLGTRLFYDNGRMTGRLRGLLFAALVFLDGIDLVLGQAILFAEPTTEVDHLAASAAKRELGPLVRPLPPHPLTTDRAGS